MKNLTLREKIGQMLIIKIQGKEITNETKRMIEEYKVGAELLPLLMNGQVSVNSDLSHD